ncbi:bifunctional alpha/beta hydrolase/OsmC family protein [Arenibacter sp. F20364]|uniref:bifunctional alpha/beta hydrolase/OsmC family protein n=1 Tax=Arenibacter sp. F20364 TaxID=2926415 RepID=UPI001FF45E25|nr:bifunctional alpha/beta hydrolase/OsmC family protein [Arenibacter sp. F20364]MCK0191191.1 bifunctional alpha/beta hydrolase/OsmC family protein [Arenibacter sp. F20364]
MNHQKVSFKNGNGETLVGRISLPANQHPHNFVLFAHCFTCNKNLTAIRNISRALTADGFGVLRFDFTGLGESEGEFSDSNFSGNVEDLLEAAKYLEEHYISPTLIIGHSLGGAAAILAAQQISSIKAIATIGAPSDPLHVKHIFKDDIETITDKGTAEVNIGGRSFTIKKQFLEDLKSQSFQETLKNIGKSILILHSPQDNIVEIKNAEEIYIRSHHPKSFVSLDGADHLLSNPKDASYTGEIIGKWSKRYLEMPGAIALETEREVVSSLDASDGFTTQMKVGSHYITADEPVSYGGNNFGPSPYELVSAGLSACTAMTIQMYVKRKKWPLENVEVHTSYQKLHAADCTNCDSSEAKIDTFQREIKLTGDLDDKQIARIMEIADKCPVHKTLKSEINIATTLLNK